MLHDSNLMVFFFIVILELLLLVLCNKISFFFFLNAITLQSRKMQEQGWKPRWFAKDKATDTYRYSGGYWEARERHSWDSCPDIFGQPLQTIQ